MPKPNVREQIVSTSLALLHSKGFNATSVQDITDAAGVPKGSFYNHFASKEALGLEVLRRYTDGVAEVRAVLEDTTQAPLARLRRYFSSMIELNANNDFSCGCLLGNFSAELANQSPPMRQQLALDFGSWGALLAGVIGAAQQDGSVGKDHTAAELADFMVDAWQGAVLRSKAEHSRAPLERFLSMTMSRLLV